MLNNTITMNLNQAKSGIELTFAEKPSDAIREQLKELGFRWSNKLGFWWARQTDARLALAKSLCEQPKAEPKVQKQPKAKAPKAAKAEPKVQEKTAPKAEPKAKAEPKVQELKLSNLSEKCKYTIATKNGFETVKGYVFTAGLGKCKKLHLGVAKGKDGLWTLTELSTGYKIGALVGYAKRYLALESIDEALIAETTKYLKSEKGKRAAANMAALNA